MSLETKIFGFEKMFYISAKKVSLRDLYSQLVGLILSTRLSHVLSITGIEGACNGKC